VTITVTADNAWPAAVADSGTARSGPAAGEQITINAAANLPAWRGLRGTDTFTYEVTDALSCLWPLDGVSRSAGCGADVQFPLPDGKSLVALQVADTSDNLSPATSVTINVLSNSATVAEVSGGNRTVADSNGAPGEVVAMDGSATIPDGDGVAGENVQFEGSATDTDGTFAFSIFRWIVNCQALPAVNDPPNPVLALLEGRRKRSTPSLPANSASA
jgi:hypothetical protein